MGWQCRQEERSRSSGIPPCSWQGTSASTGAPGAPEGLPLLDLSSFCPGVDGLPAKTQTCTRFTAASLGSSLFTHTSVRSCGWSDTKRVCCSLQGQICWHDPLLPAGSRCLICCNTHFGKPLQRLPFPEVSLPHAVISEVWGFVHVHAEERV